MTGLANPNKGEPFVFANNESRVRDFLKWIDVIMVVKLKWKCTFKILHCHFDF